MNSNKNIVLQIFGSLMKKPSLLTEVDKYVLVPSDFESSFEQYIFGAIYNLQTNGADRITVVDIDNYLSNKDFAYKIFTSNNGIEYLQDAEDLAVVENFTYYYNSLKKINAIKDLKRIGYDTSKIYPENILDTDYEKKIEFFETLVVSDIFDIIKKELAKVEDKYGAGATKESIKANDKIVELINELKVSPDIGYNLQGHIFNTIVRGARKGKYYIRSASSGVGKSRSMVADASYLAYPIRYDSSHKKWVSNGACEKVLYIATEQEPKEIQTMILAYLTEINEEKILFGRYDEEEEIILKQAVEVMNRYSDNFHIVQLPNPSIGQIKATIRKYSLVNEVEYVFYDYIFSSPALLSEFKGINIREDVVLLMLSTMLKDLAVELDIFMMTATQLNGEADKMSGIKNQNAIRG